MLSCARYTLAQKVPATAGARVSAPADGTITSWRMAGEEHGHGGRVSARVQAGRGRRVHRGGRLERRCGRRDRRVELHEQAFRSRIGDIGIDLDPGASGSAGIYNNAGSGTIAYWLGLDEGTTAAPLGTFTGSSNAQRHHRARASCRDAAQSGLTARPRAAKLVAIKGDIWRTPPRSSSADTPATSFSKVSNTQINAVTPPGSAGTVDTTVDTMAGTSTPSTGGRYTYVAPGGHGGAGAATTPGEGELFRVEVLDYGRPQAALQVQTSRPHRRYGQRSLFKSLKGIRVSRRKLVSLATKPFTVP